MLELLYWDQPMKTALQTRTITLESQTPWLRILKPDHIKLMPGNITPPLMILAFLRLAAVWLLCVLLFIKMDGLAATNYVWQDSPTPAPPYTNWAKAAHTIQEAVDAAQVGDTVLVTNGVYSSGGRTVSQTLTNRVAIDKAITVKSFAGPEVTLIVGAPAPGGTTGDGAIRCVYLAYGGVLSGFTLTNGHTRSSGADNSQCNGAGCRGEGILTNCIFINNSAARDGGGASHVTLFDCTLVGNTAGDDGGGTDTCALFGCVLRGNTAQNNGGGASESTLYNCTVISNACVLYDPEGGGAYNSVLYNCTVMGNRSHRDGGGAYGSTLYNCALTGNKASRAGGGADACELYNCTLTANKAGRGGGVADSSVLRNCIVYHNQASVGPNFYGYGVDFYSSCTTPLPAGGTGNIDADPQLASWTHLSSTSPCLGAGSALYATGLDIDGEPWGTPPSIGADELVPAAANSLLSVALETDLTAMTVGFAAYFRAQIEGQVTSNRWDFADGTRLTNGLEAVHAWNIPGSYPVRLTAFNHAYPDGISATVTVQVVQTPVCYVNPANPSPSFPYASWATAATNIQDAIGASPVAGRLVVVTNGVYDTGGVAVEGLMTNRIALTNGVVVRSVNGPAVTILRGAPAPGGGNGDGAIRCAYVGDGSLLAGFTLTNGHTRTDGHNSREQGGGGAWCEQRGVVTNCILVGNEAHFDGGGANGGVFYRCTFLGNRAWQDSGGADDATLYDCLLTANSAGAAASDVGSGGGAGESILIRCTLTGNSATGFEASGGGAYDSTLNNCILYYNTVQGAPDNYDGGTLNHCCTTPLPTGLGNITNAPLFVDRLNGNLRLHSNSPCINAGDNTYASGPTDLDGNPRIVNGTVDMGAYEWQVPACFAPLALPGPHGLDLTLTGEVGRTYDLHASANLMSWSWLARLTNTTGYSTYTDPLSPRPPARFYRATAIP
jgi:PKD repeat protein